MVKCECTVKHLWLLKTIYIFRSSLSVCRFTTTVNWAWYRSSFLLRELREVLFNQYLQMQLKQYSIEIRFSSNTFFFCLSKVCNRCRTVGSTYWVHSTMNCLLFFFKCISPKSAPLHDPKRTVISLLHEIRRENTKIYIINTTQCSMCACVRGILRSISPSASQIRWTQLSNG